MTSHFTIRMCWHDNCWDGKTCKDPKNNFYCVGSRSLLSERVARKRNKELEMKSANKEIDGLGSYIPPCYWSSAAFSSKGHKVVHEHPFRKYEETKKISEILKPYSMFSWPFRLSFVHDKKTRRILGRYHDMKKRMPRFISKFEPGASIAFFYLNYDNPISGDEEKYALVGCAVIGEKPQMPPDFDFSADELSFEQQKEGMKNFSPMNWALQVSYDFENGGAILPYHKYLDHIRKYPDDRQKLEEMKVLIEEESLVFGFKYVLADINEDQCIFLLTKLKKAFDIVQEHGIVNVEREQDLIDQLLKRIWIRRGLYPGLANVLEFVMDDEAWNGIQFVNRLHALIPPGSDVCEEIFSLLTDDAKRMPKNLKELDADIERLRTNFSQHTSIEDLLRKLSLFSLKKRQFRNIILQNADSFAREVNASDIVENPYVLCEEYRYELAPKDMDEEEIEDDAIDLFKIDIGMFPEKHVRSNVHLQNLAPASPERLRAVIIKYLYSIGAQGDCFSVLEDVYDNILNNPLFYKRELKLNKGQLLSESYKDHFDEKLAIIPNANRHYFYLNEALCAEKKVNETITKLLKRDDWLSEIKDVEAFVKAEAQKLKQSIKDFNEARFIEERTKVLKSLPKKSFYVISGKPGTGKTKILEKIIRELANWHEEVTVLAPTGKASLRLKVECKAKDAQTIDRFIYSDENEYWEILENFSLILKEGRPFVPIENLILDESSMIDLQKLAALFSMLKLDGEHKIKRVIMVGDENQLPPIGFGRPFYDIVQYLKFDAGRKDKNYVKLLTNCRNELDPKIMEFADIFTEKNRYYSELLDDILNCKGDVSPGLALERWVDADDLQVKIDQRLDRVITNELTPADASKCKNKPQKLNLLFGLYENGFVRPYEPLGIDNFQMITPYRTERFGSMALSQFFKSNYPRGHWADSRYKEILFDHADKIIRLTNEYIFDYRIKKRVMRLSNGSIGIVNNKCNDRTNPPYRQYFFTDQESPLYSKGYNRLKEDENFELAYAITVHKSQGSDFRNVFLVIPGKRSLLSKELIYTALTRSKRSTTVFLQKEEGKEILEEARNRSAVLERNTSIFELPENAKEIFEPTKGKKVKSKIEYILFKALETSGLKFEYEEPLCLEKGPQLIRPDFTICVDDKTYYWEHLGELDLKEYWTLWMARRDWYEANGKINCLITTDDLGGVAQEKINGVCKNIKEGKLALTASSKFSRHHYRLYE